MTDPQPSRLKDYILDENLCPVARMRLFSEGINRNTRLLQQDAAIGDRACLACGNCVDACPVVADTQRFVFLQNQRTSMALENMVADECRRCYRCIQACPQVAKAVKDYAGAFRRGEKIIHLLIAITILLLAASGITVYHYGENLPQLETSLLTYAHRVLGLVLIILPILYLILDKHHLLRLFRKIVSWNAQDRQWLRDLVRHVKDPAQQALPYTGEFNPGQKAWYLFISLMIPFMAVTGLLLWLVFQETESAYSVTLQLHVLFALLTDMLLFVHIYLKYLRKWALRVYEVVKVFRSQGHLDYAALYVKKR